MFARLPHYVSRYEACMGTHSSAVALQSLRFVFCSGRLQASSFSADPESHLRRVIYEFSFASPLRIAQYVV
jgi:hypothetical protein